MAITTIIITAITSVLSSGATFLLTKKKYNSEVDNTVIANMQKSLDFYIQLCDDTEDRLNILLEKNTALMNKMEVIVEDNINLKVEVGKLNAILSKIVEVYNIDIPKTLEKDLKTNEYEDVKTGNKASCSNGRRTSR